MINKSLIISLKESRKQSFSDSSVKGSPATSRIWEILSDKSARNYTWSKNGYVLTASFQTNAGNEYDIYFVDLEDDHVAPVEVEVTFSTAGDQYFGDTGKFEQLEVLSTVKAAVLDYLESYSPIQLIIVTDKNGKRGRVYSKIAKKMSWEVSMMGYETIFKKGTWQERILIRRGS